MAQSNIMVIFMGDNGKDSQSPKFSAFEERIHITCEEGQELLTLHALQKSTANAYIQNKGGRHFIVYAATMNKVIDISHIDEDNLEKL